MKVVAKLLIDKDGNPCIVAKCIMGIHETKGKFGVGFGLAKINGNLSLFAFRETTDNPIAVLSDKEKAIEWLEKALEKNGYKWYHFYTSEVEEIDGLYAFMVPFDAEGWNRLDNNHRETFRKMLGLLKK